MSLFSCCGCGDGDRTDSQEDLKKDRSAGITMSDGSVVAVVLSGCGFLDGSEVHEVAHVCAAVEKRGAKIRFFAPDARQKDEVRTVLLGPFNAFQNCCILQVNHKTNESNSDTDRGTLIESARIARGNIESLAVRIYRSITNYRWKLVFCSSFATGFKRRRRRVRRDRPRRFRRRQELELVRPGV